MPPAVYFTQLSPHLHPQEARDSWFLRHVICCSCPLAPWLLSGVASQNGQPPVKGWGSFPLASLQSPPPIGHQLPKKRHRGQNIVVQQRSFDCQAHLAVLDRSESESCASASHVCERSWAFRFSILIQGSLDYPFQSCKLRFPLKLSAPFCLLLVLCGFPSCNGQSKGSHFLPGSLGKWALNSETPWVQDRRLAADTCVWLWPNGRPIAQRSCN